MNKKYLMVGLPIILGIMLVSAGAIYLAQNINFQKIVHVTGQGSHYVYVEFNGDIQSSDINCDSSPCQARTGDIYLKNNDKENSHSCVIVTTEKSGHSSGIDVSYVGIDDPNNVTIPPSGQIDFQVVYNSNTEGDYYMFTEIICSA